MEINGKTDRADIAEEFNKFFCDIGLNPAKNIPNSMLELNFDKNPDHPDFEFIEITDVDIKKLLFSISDEKATGNDGLPIRFLKMAHTTVVPILVHIINSSLRTLIVPHEWKTAVVSPVFRIGQQPPTIGQYLFYQLFRKS